MTACSGCGKDCEARYRFCPWCGAAQRRKLVEFFRPHPHDAGRMLQDTPARSLGMALRSDFSRVSDRVAAEVCRAAQVPASARPRG